MCGAAPDNDGQLAPLDELLDEHLVSIGKRFVDRLLEFILMCHNIDTDARPLLRCFDHDGQVKRGTHIFCRVFAPCTRMKAEKTRCRDPLGAKDTLCRQLVHRQCGSAYTRAGIGNTEHIERPLQDSVLAVLSMQRIEYNCGAEFLNLLGKCGGIQFQPHGRIAFLAQCRKDCRTRTARDLRLCRGPTHDDDDRLLARTRRPVFQLLHECLPHFEDVARAHRDNEIACTHMLCEVAFEIRTLRQVDRILPRVPRDLLHQSLTADPRNRCLSRRIDIGQKEQIGSGKARAELRAQELRPRVTMRLKDTDEPRGIRCACRRKRYGDLRRMVCIVVHHPDTALLPLRLETALCPVESRKSISYLRELHSGKTRDCDTGKRVEDIVPPRDVE